MRLAAADLSSAFTSAFRTHTQRQCSTRSKVYGLRVVLYDDAANTAEVPLRVHAQQRESSSRRTYHTCAAKTKIASGLRPGLRSCWRATRTSSALSLRPPLSRSCSAESHCHCRMTRQGHLAQRWRSRCADISSTSCPPSSCDLTPTTNRGHRRDLDCRGRALIPPIPRAVPERLRTPASGMVLAISSYSP